MTFEEYIMQETGHGTRDHAKQTIAIFQDRYNKLSQSGKDSSSSRIGGVRDGGGDGEGNYMTGATSFLQGFPLTPQMQEYMEDFYPYIQELMQRPMAKYPGKLRMEAPADEDWLFGRMRERIEAGPGLTAPPSGVSEAYEGAFEQYLPQFRRSYEELTKNPAAERLEKMGLSGSSPGIEFMANLGEGQAIREAGLRQDVDINRAGALRQEWQDTMGWEQAQRAGGMQDMSTYFNMMARPEQRELGNIGREYGDWMMREKLPYEMAGMLGLPMAQLSLGGMKDLYTSGGAFETQLGVANIGADAMKYGADMGLKTAQWEAQFMKPFYEQASEPVQVGDSSGCCVIASVVNGNRYAYPVQVCRIYRDREMGLNMQKGYYRFAEAVVPLMFKFKSVMKLMRKLVYMGVDYLEYRNGMKPTKPRRKSTIISWLFYGLFNLLGVGGKFVRSNGETTEASIKRHTKNLAKRVYKEITK